MRRIAFLAAMLAFALPWPACAEEAKFRLLRIDRQLVKWGEPVLGRGAVVRYAFADRVMDFPSARNCRAIMPIRLRSPAGSISNAAVETAFRDAAAEWSDVADIRFRQVRSAAEADLLVGAQVYPRGRAFANVTPDARPDIERAIRDRIARSATPSGRQEQVRPGTRSASIAGSLVCLNAQKRWKIGFDGNRDVYDLRYTFMHEIGHVLGLNHVGASGAVMSFGYDEQFRRLQPGDKAGAVVLYGPADAVR